MNPLLDTLQTYPFEKLAEIKNGLNPPSNLKHISLSIGEPKHSPPEFVLNALQDAIQDFGKYSATKGSIELRAAISQWAARRFNMGSNTLNVDTQILPVNGTREALFAIAQATVDHSQPTAKVLMPNPFYQIYEGAALLSGAKPVFINCDTPNALPDFKSLDQQSWQDCQLLYLCSPGNPSGAVFKLQDYLYLLELADKYNFVIAADECYSELYFDENTPPLGLLQVCNEVGRKDFRNCLVFHSLSKRSNLPGLRSGFVAGDAELIEKFFAYRTYHGCAMPLPVQAASIAAWNDEKHVQENRERYREKFDDVISILSRQMSVERPEAGFYLWLTTPYDDVRFTADLFEQQNVTVLPGSFLARDTSKGNPGKNKIRIALVATREECLEAANRINIFLAENE